MHHSRDKILQRFREGDTFTVELEDGDTAWDPETGDSLLGPSAWRYRRGSFPGPGLVTERVDL